MNRRMRTAEGAPTTPIVLSIVLLFVTSGLITMPTAGAVKAQPKNAFLTKIQHVVIVVMENHAYDAYYGVYCTVLGQYCSSTGVGVPNTCIKLWPSTPWKRPCVVPFNFTAANDSITTSMPHNYNSSHLDWNNGSMNNFYAAEGSGLDPFGHYNGTTAPVYWDLAEQYSLDDSYFSSEMSYTLPNRWHFVAGMAPAEVIVHGLGDTTGGNPGNKTTYLAEANATQTIVDEINASTTKVGWKYFDYSLPTYKHAIAQRGGPGYVDSAYDYWNPLAAKAESYTSWYKGHFVPNTAFFGMAANGTLPSISWVTPSTQYSDHPPANTTAAQGWLASVVDSVEASPDWNTTALFITFDEDGGFYDQVDPPAFNNQTLGFRVPLIVVSPYSRENYIDPTTYDADSILHLLEWRWNLGCLGYSCTAPLPLDMFNFSQSPRSPITNFGYNTTYPMVLENNSAPFKPAVPYNVPGQYVADPEGAGLFAD